MDFKNLYLKAKNVINPRKLSCEAEAGGVGAAILTKAGNVYVGVCIDTACSMGFCAEHAAAASMITAGENEVEKMIAVNYKGKIIPPCGRCREFISQLSDVNAEALVQVSKKKVAKLKDLLPYDWQKTH